MYGALHFTFYIVERKVRNLEGRGEHSVQTSHVQFLSVKSHCDKTFIHTFQTICNGFSPPKVL